MKREYRLFLEDIIKNISYVEDFIADMDFDTFKSDEKTVYAVERCLEIIAEAASKIPEDVKEMHSDINWKDIKNFRNIVVHKYWGIDMDILWDVISNELEPLKVKIIKLLDSK